jgi:hypothetical protein
MSIDKAVSPLHNTAVDPGAAPVGKVRLLAFSYWFLAKAKAKAMQ